MRRFRLPRQRAFKEIEILRYPGGSVPRGTALRCARSTWVEPTLRAGLGAIEDTKGSRTHPNI